MSKLDILFETKEFTSVKVHLSKVREREKMGGQYLLQNGKKVDGFSYNNNDLSGTLEFFNNDHDDLSSEEFLKSFKENNWALFVEQSIDKFQGPGRSIDYEFDDFDEFIEGNSDGCEYDANIEPDYLIFNFEGNYEKFVFDGNGNYKYKGEVLNKADLLKILGKYIVSESQEACGTPSNTGSVDVDSLFTVDTIHDLKKLFERMLNDEDLEINEFESAIVSNKSVAIFPQEDPKALHDAEQYIIRLEERIYKKTEIKSSSTITKFNILYSNKDADLKEFKKALSAYIQIGGSHLDFKI
jgi:hypothetical protein